VGNIAHIKIKQQNIVQRDVFPSFYSQTH